MPDKFYNADMQGPNLAPTARVLPTEQRSVVSSRVRFDGRSSSDPEGDVLSYIWSFASVPIGSTITSADLVGVDAAASSVTFSPDVTGPFVVSLVVSDGQFSSPSAEGLVTVGAVRAPSCSDILPDGKFFFRVISDYWEDAEEREMLPVIWSSYLQMAAAELLELYQVDYDKSIETILEQRQWRWAGYKPLLPLNSAEHYVIVGSQNDGTLASTGAVGDPSSGYVLSSTEFVVVEGAIRESMVGEELTLLSGVNAGDYIIQRALPGKYRVEQDDLFPTPAALATNVDMTTVANSAVVRSALTDFSTVALLEVGDYLRLNGLDAGTYIITGIGTADGLPDDFSLQLSSVLTTTESGVTFSVFDKVAGFIAPIASPLTDIVRIPLTANDDLTGLNRPNLSGVASISSTREIVTGKRFVFDALIGNMIALTGGSNSGHYVIAAVNPARDGYLITGAFSGSFPQSNVGFSLPPVTTAAGRLVLVNGKAYTLRRVFNDQLQPLPPLGPGSVSIGVLDRAVLPTGLEDAAWRVPAVLVSETRESGELVDYEELGVRVGDLLVFEVEHTDTGRRSELTASVVGVDRNRVGFEFGVEDIVAGAHGEPSDADKIALASALGITGASLDIAGNLSLEGMALDIDTALRSLLFSTDFHDLPLWPTTDIEVAGSEFRLEVSHIVRNSAIPVDPRVLSVPCLKEYVSVPIVATSTSGVAIITRDGERLERSNAPVVLAENDDYIIDAETDILGVDGVTVAGSAIFTAAAGFFLSRNVETGDVLTVGDAAFAVIQVLSETQLQALSTTTGSPFTQALSSLSWSIRRVTPGRYIRFIPGTFTVKQPAPDVLWGEVTFIDNYEAIERNFGLMVALRYDDLTSRATASTTYREAVLGLMYAWAMGPKLANVRLGAQILTGLPVADVKGRILDIDDSFSASPALGRILAEDLDKETGTPTGLTRIYFFPPLTSSDLADYAGLEVNPATGQLYQVGDVIERFAPLSKGLIITDYVEDPRWWQGQVYQGDSSAEIRKFHTWTLKAAAGVIDDDDFELAVEFARTIDPVWTDVRPVLVLPLSDTITIEDELLFKVTEHLIDDPFGSIESTAKASDSNGAGYFLNLVGVGPLSSRMLFFGDDLAIPAGAPEPVTFTSARGGFEDPLTVPPHTGFPVVPVDHGSPLVRSGDLVFVSEGPNKGWFAVNTVDSDTSITVVKQSPLPLDSPTTDELQLETGAKFFIFRLSRNPITSGTAEYYGTLDTFTDPDVCFFTEGVAQDDILILQDGQGRGVYEIVEVQDPGADIYPWDTLRVVPDIVGLPPSGPASISNYEIRRPALQTNPLMTGTTLMSVAGTNVLTLAGANFDLRMLQTYDELEITASSNSDNVGRYQILDTPPLPTIGNQLYVRPPIPANADNTFVITRPGLSETVLQLGRVAQFFPREELTLTLIRPRTTVVATASDVTASVIAVDDATTAPNEARTVFTSGATDFVVAGAQAGDFLEVGTSPTLLVADDNTGVWPVISVMGGTITVSVELATSLVNTMARVLRDDPTDFTIAGDAVNSTAGGFTAVGLIPGDRFEVLSGPLAGTYIVASVTDNNNLVLTQSVGAGSAACRIYRLVR